MNFEEALKLADAAVFTKTNKHLRDIEIIVLRGSWEGQEYHKIAETYGYAAEYLMQDVGPKLWKLLSEALGERVSKKNFKEALERRSHLQPEMPAQPILPTVSSGVTGNPLRQDWGEAPDTSMFFGRDTDLNKLNQWILRDRCRLVALLGMGGIGKTALAAKLGEAIQGEFEYLIWRSLRYAPPLLKILTELNAFASSSPETSPRNLLRSAALADVPAIVSTKFLPISPVRVIGSTELDSPTTSQNINIKAINPYFFRTSRSFEK